MPWEISGAITVSTKLPQTLHVYLRDDSGGRVKSTEELWAINTSMKSFSYVFQIRLFDMDGSPPYYQNRILLSLIYVQVRLSGCSKLKSVHNSWPTADRTKNTKWNIGIQQSFTCILTQVLSWKISCKLKKFKIFDWKFLQYWNNLDQVVFRSPGAVYATLIKWYPHSALFLSLPLSIHIIACCCLVSNIYCHQQLGIFQSGNCCCSILSYWYWYPKVSHTVKLFAIDF